MKSVEQQRQLIKKECKKIAKEFEEDALKFRDLSLKVEEMTETEVQEKYNVLQLMQLARKFARKIKQKEK